MPAQVRRIEGNYDDVPRTRFDPLVASGAQVTLRCLIGLDARDRYLGIRAHARMSAITTKAAARSA
jgi:hypothetical protein